MQVCPTGVPADLRAEEYSQMAKALIETATTATPQLPLTALLVQVSRHLKEIPVLAHVVIISVNIGEIFIFVVEGCLFSSRLFLIVVCSLSIIYG